MDIVIASENKHKIKEIKAILKGLPIRVLSPGDLGSELKVTEDKNTFRGNALKKSFAAARKFGLPALADDSGLMVDALSGAPGVRSARFAGPRPTTEKLCRKLLKHMKNVPLSKRNAKFVCNIAIVPPKGRIRVVEGVCRGKIGRVMLGKKGFGYDPVFIPSGYKKTFAQMVPAFKNRISHRAKALKKARVVLIEEIKRG